MIGVARSAATALGEEHDGQAAPLDDVEEPVLFPMSHHSLGPGEHGVVVREDRAVRAFLSDQGAVDASGPRDEPVGGRPVHEIVDAPPATLRRDGETAVLDEAAVVAQVGEILACGPASRRVARGHDVSSALVADQAAAAQRLSEIGTRGLQLLIRHPMSLGAPVSRRECPPSCATGISPTRRRWATRCRRQVCRCSTRDRTCRPRCARGSRRRSSSIGMRRLRRRPASRRPDRRTDL